MAVQPLSKIKEWFEANDIPTQSQFWDTWDSFWHKLEGIPTSGVTGLDTTLGDLYAQVNSVSGTGEKVVISLSGTGTYALADGMLLQDIVFVGSGNLKVGTGAGGSDIFEENVALPGISRNLGYHAFGAKTLHFTGNGVVKLYLR